VFWFSAPFLFATTAPTTVKAILRSETTTTTSTTIALNLRSTCKLHNFGNCYNFNSNNDGSTCNPPYHNNSNDYRNVACNDSSINNGNGLSDGYGNNYNDDDEDYDHTDPP